MKVKFTLELFDAVITNSIEIPEYDLESVTEENKEDFIYEYITNEINNNIQITLHEDFGDE